MSAETVTIPRDVAQAAAICCDCAAVALSTAGLHGEGAARKTAALLRAALLPEPPKDDATNAPDSGLTVIADSLRAISSHVPRP